MIPSWLALTDRICLAIGIAFLPLGNPLSAQTEQTDDVVEALAQEKAPDGENIDFGLAERGGTIVANGRSMDEALLAQSEFGRTLKENPAKAVASEVARIESLLASRHFRLALTELEKTLKTVGSSRVQGNGSFMRDLVAVLERFPDDASSWGQAGKQLTVTTSNSGSMQTATYAVEPEWQLFLWRSIFDVFLDGADVYLRLGDVVGAKRLYDRIWARIAIITPDDTVQAPWLLNNVDRYLSHLKNGYELIGASAEMRALVSKKIALEEASGLKPPPGWIAATKSNEAKAEPDREFPKTITYQFDLIRRAELLLAAGHHEASRALLEGGFFAGPDVDGIARYKTPEADVREFRAFRAAYKAGSLYSRISSRPVSSPGRTAPKPGDAASLTAFLPLALAEVNEKLGNVEDAEAYLAYALVVNPGWFDPTMPHNEHNASRDASSAIDVLYRVAKSQGTVASIRSVLINDWVRFERNRLRPRTFNADRRQGEDFRTDIEVAQRLRRLADISDSVRGNEEKTILLLKLAINRIDSLRGNLSEVGPQALVDFTQEWFPVYERAQTLLVAAGRFAEAEAVGRLVKALEQSAFIRGVRSKYAGQPLALTDRENFRRSEFDSLVSGLVATQDTIEKSYRTQRGRPGIAKGRYQQPDLTAAERLVEQKRADLFNQELNDRERSYFDAAAEIEAWLATPAAAEADNAATSSAKPADRAGTSPTGDPLGKGVARLQISIHPERLLLLLQTDRGMKFSSVDIPRERVNKAAFTLRQELERARNPNVAVMPSHITVLKQRSRHLFDLLVRPIEPQLKAQAIHTILFDVQGSLRYVPLAALWDGKRWLVERFTVVSAAAGAGTRGRTESALKSGVGLGTSNSFAGFSPLPAVAEELEAILTGADGKGSLSGSIALNGDFSRASFVQGLQTRNPVVHVASHFVVRPGDDTASFLLLGDGSHLYLSELSKNPDFDFTNVDLLALSACETALASGGSGAEVEGLATVALSRGAKTVLASLWSVDDVGTRNLMEVFYRELSSGQTGRAEALRKAQIALIKSDEDSNPYYWGSFIIMGDWR